MRCIVKRRCHAIAFRVEGGDANLELNDAVIAIAEEIGIQKDRMTAKNYFDRYIDVVDPVKTASISMSIENHSEIRGEKVVEIRDKTGLVATVVPRNDEIRVVSKYLSDIIKDTYFPPIVMLMLKRDGRS